MVEQQVKEKKKDAACSDLLSYLEILEKRKLASGKVGTASLYKATRHQLEAFMGTKKFHFKLVNTYLVQDFVLRLQSLSLSQNSISNYTSIFRTAYNSAVANHLVAFDAKPFQHLHLHPVQTYKRAVDSHVIKDITRLDLKSQKRLDFARDLFMFSFMACGMAFVDLAHLTRENIHGNLLVYYRVKTKTEIRVTITPGMRRILNKYADANSKLLFPVLKSVDVSYESYKVALRTYNRRLETIGNKLATPVKLTSYVARHSWAMCAKENAISIAIISQALGHLSEKTTAYYLTFLGQPTMEKANMKIIGFVEQWAVNNLFMD